MASTSASTEPRPARGQIESEPAYDPVSLREFWGLLSILCFTGAIAFRYVAWLLPRGWFRWDRIPPTTIYLVPILSALGLALALLAGRKNTVTGRVGFLANAIVFGLSLVLLTLIAIWRMSR